MQVKSKDGNRTVKLERGEHATLVKARDICSELVAQVKDDLATEAVEPLASLCERHAPPAPKPRKGTGAETESKE